MKVDLMPIVKLDFGEVSGIPVELYEIVFPGFLEAKITNYGGILCALKLPNRDGKMENIVLGHDNLQAYLVDEFYLGGIVGRFGNRIAASNFPLNGKNYQVTNNIGANHLHGGTVGFNAQVWDEVSIEDGPLMKKLTFQYKSKDGEEGYPGNLLTKVQYVFTSNSFEIKYEAVSDANTVLNLTHHSYFNLSGNQDNSILDHQLSLKADHFLEVDDESIPTGRLLPVDASPFDFNNMKPIDKDINHEDDQLKIGSGYDHCFVLSNSPTIVKKLVGNLEDPSSGRGMALSTTQPGVQLYTGNFLDNPFKRRTGLCLETQHFPDAPNHPNFPSTVLKKGERFTSSTKHEFYLIDEKQ